MNDEFNECVECSIPTLEITLYTTHCPKCLVLEKKLKEKNISYTEVSDIETMQLKGFTQAPMLQVGDAIMDFTMANRWINSK